MKGIKLDFSRYYNECSGKPLITQEMIEDKIERISSGNLEKDRSELLKEMGILGDREIPFFIYNSCGKWINPFIVFKFFGEYGLPVEFFIDELSKRIKEDAGIYWYEWCDFWLDTFIKGDLKKIRENFII